MYVAFQVPAVPRPSCKSLYNSRGNIVPTPEASLEGCQASYRRSPHLLPADQIDCEPTLAELVLATTWTPFRRTRAFRHKAMNPATSIEGRNLRPILIFARWLRSPGFNCAKSSSQAFLPYLIFEILNKIFGTFVSPCS